MYVTSATNCAGITSRSDQVYTNCYSLVRITIGREAHAMKRAFGFNVVRAKLAVFGDQVNPDAISEGQCHRAAVIRNGKVEGAE